MIASGGGGRNESPDSREFHESCARIEKVSQRLEAMGVHDYSPFLGVKTFNGNTKADPRRNGFGDLESDEERQSGSDEDKTGADDGDHGGFTEVVRKRRSETSHIGQHRLYTVEDCKVFSELYNLYFKCITGKDLDFIITPASQPFVSTFEACFELHHLLATLFNKRPTWVDPFGGSGGDACAALFCLYPWEVYIGEYMYTTDAEEQTAQFVDMKHNIGNMQQLFDSLNPENPDAPKVHMMNSPSDEFLRTLSSMGVSIDILYLDPNWYKGGPGQETERSPKEMMTYLNFHVIKPLKESGKMPKCIVFKTRWLSQVLWPFMKLLTPDYHPMYSIEATPFRTKIDEKKFQDEGEVRGRFHWVVIVHNELRTVHWHKSDVYTSLFTNREDVYIEKKDLMEPQIPAYAGIIPYPKRSERTSGPGLVHIHPPARSASSRPSRRITVSKFKSRGGTRA